MRAILQQQSDAGLDPSVLGVGVINPGTEHGGDCEHRLLVSITLKVVGNKPLVRRLMIATWGKADFCGTSSTGARLL